MKCPVCKTEIQESAKVCPNCKFAELEREFISVEDAIEWMNSVVTHYRAAWLLENTEMNSIIDLDSNESKLIFQKYCTDKHHTLKVESLTINTKFASFIWEREDNGHITREIQKFGYKYFNFNYDKDGDDISFYMQNKSDSNIRHPIASITLTNEKMTKELLTVFEFMKTGDLHFEYAFDDSVEWYKMYPQDKTDNYYVSMNYFSDEEVRPLSLKAQFIEYDEYAENHILANGYYIIELLVQNENNQAYSANDQAFGSKMFLNIKKTDLLTDICIDETWDLSEARNDIFINNDNVYVGRTDNYQLFHFDNVISARRFYDYIIASVQKLF